jgi:2-oxoacid dehydrogenases acyltransferase (catalytic domain)
LKPANDPAPQSALKLLRALLKQPPAASTSLPYPALRNFVLDVLAEGRRRNTIHLLLEADVTDWRDRAGADADAVSLTALLTRHFVEAIDHDRRLHAYRHGRKKLIVFDEVDVSAIIERHLDGQTIPVVSVIRRANHKSAAEIHAELQQARVAPLGAEGPMNALERRFFLLPGVLRRAVWFFIRRNPYWFKDLIGTVGVTSMGMFGSGAAVVVPISPMSLTLSIGCIEKKLQMRNGMPCERDVVHLNLSADHDVIDGAPLMRFAERFKALIEAAQATPAPSEPPAPGR